MTDSEQRFNEIIDRASPELRRLLLVILRAARVATAPETARLVALLRAEDPDVDAIRAYARTVLGEGRVH